MSLSPRPFDLLVALASNPGRLLSRDELLQTVWKNTAVEQSSLNAAMSVLRQALGDEAAAIIETVPGRGYRFVASITSAAPASTAATAGGRALIVDDHAIVRMGVRSLLERSGCEVVGEAASLAECGERIAALQPDLLILDLMMGDQPSLPHIQPWLALAPGLRVIVLSMHDEEDYAKQALTAGAQAYVMKSGMIGELNAAIDAVRNGQYWISATLNQALIRDYLRTIAR